jgi:DNA modification methylase
VLELKVEYLAPASLTPYAGNARTHPKKQLQQIESSITAFGFVNPILIDEAGVLIAGHGRLLAAKALSLPTVPAIRLPGLSESQKRQLRLADNKIAANSAWDMELLKIELQALSVEVDFDCSVAGFAIGEIESILSEAGGTDPDDEVVPATALVPVTQPGDIWMLGSHRMGCGDCRDREMMLRLTQGRLIDAAFLDPPYNVKINGHAVSKGRHREFKFASGEMNSSEFETFLRETLGACAEVSRNGAVHFTCMDHHHLDELLAAGRAVYSKRLNLCVWNKSNAGMGSLYRSKHEVVAVYRVGDETHLNTVELGKHGRNRTNVWDYPSVNTLRGGRRHDLALHPTVKPIGLVADALKDVTCRGDLVLDAFMGSGTTLLAAERIGRCCLGLDVDPIYVDLAITRHRDQTGCEPVLEATGQTFSQVSKERAQARDDDAA